jgi:16S rRNA (cytosine1402-N4)-methyltransferase
MIAYHQPVLLHEAIEGLNIQPSGVYVDATFGGGGHSKEILKRLGKKGRLYAFDQDEEAVGNVPDDRRIIFTRGNFRFLENYLKYYGISAVDGIFADLGVSSRHFDSGERGFSYRFDAALDMRMNRQSELTAAKVVNKYEQADLERILKDYAEIKNSKKIVESIIAMRANGEISTTGDLARAVENFIPARQANQYLSRIFQALRIEVNHELENLAGLLCQSVVLLKQGGRIAVISYHSLEDRMVKNFFKSGNPEGISTKDIFGHSTSVFRIITHKPVVPTEREISENIRARSAKLRIAEKT